MKQFYYNYDKDNELLTIFNSNGNSIAHINEVKPNENFNLLVVDTLYNMNYINEIEDVELLEV